MRLFEQDQRHRLYSAQWANNGGQQTLFYRLLCIRGNFRFDLKGRYLIAYKNDTSINIIHADKAKITKCTLLIYCAVQY